MGKYLGLLMVVLLMGSCDDGDIKVEAINFDTVNASSCGDVIYKLRENEALFFKVSDGITPFVNEVTPIGSPRIFTIGSQVIVKYRGYNGAVTAANLCPDAIQPIFPVATVEWNGIGGNMEVTTTPVMSAPNETTGATKLISYNHNIIFKNIIFLKPSGRQIYNEFVFGDYTTPATTLPLAFTPANIHLCASGNTLYNAIDGGIEGMFIENLDPSLLSTDILDTPKTGYISATTNKLSYRLFQTALPNGGNDAYFCSSPFPATPVVNEEWLADPGANVTGIIEVTTTSNGSAFEHTIRLKGVTFRKGAVSFYFGNDIYFGQLIL
jgi:hypothetical protein